MAVAAAYIKRRASTRVKLRVATLERLVLKALLDMAREAKGEAVTVTTAAVLRRAFPGLRLPPVYAQAAYAIIKAALSGVCREEEGHEVDMSKGGNGSTSRDANPRPWNGRRIGARPRSTRK